MLPLKRLQKSNTIENLWLYILTLARKKPIYAYVLQKEIKKQFGFKPGRITSYRVLYRLEKECLVKSNLKNHKRIYQITAKGKAELEEAKEIYKKVLKML